MKAVCWWGKGEVRVLDVPDPKILNPTFRDKADDCIKVVMRPQ